MVADRNCTCWPALGKAVSNCWTFSAKGRCCTSSSKQLVQPELDGGAHPTTQNTASDGAESTREVSDEIRQGSNLRVFAFNELKAATRNFRPDSKLGVGGFGSVFKGWIDEHGTAAVKPGTGLTVAVKQLNHEGHQGHREWLAEVNFLGQLHHPNLVKLIGYCIEDDHRLLVYEFMPRGSLENHLFRHGVLPLLWPIRMKIALGAAKGLAFLHGAKKPVIYRDFKTSNILLDSEYTAKLSDFGLAKDGPEGDKTHVSTRVMGTYGYAAPEYVMTGHLTSRSDVYSFGVVLLEMITGRRSMDKNRPSGEHNLVEWARPFLSDKRKAFRLVDHRLDRQVPMKGLQKALSLANACLSRDAKCRPLMSEVVSTLEPLQLVKDAQGSFYYHQTINGLKDRIRPNGGDSQNRHPSYQSNHQIPQNGLTRLNGGTNGRSFEQMPKQPSKG